MSSGAQDQRTAALKDLVRELRQLNGLGASFFRAAAARTGMTVTDMQVIESLAATGPTTAGQLADLTGLTTGAITGMLNRLEEARLVRRERDPEDGRRVIVRLAQGKGETGELGSLFASLEAAWAELAARYNDDQLALLLDFLSRGNTLTRTEIGRLREAPAGEGGIVSAPLGDLESAQLVVFSAATRLTLRADAALTTLYQARFEGPAPEVKVSDGTVTIRYPRRLLMLGGTRRAAEVILNATLPWRLLLQGGTSEIAAELGSLQLAGLEVKGGVSTIRLELPVPAGTVPIRVSGGASVIMVRRPASVAARVHLRGWVSTFAFDDQAFSNAGNNVRLQSPGYDAADQRYDIEVASSASTVTITTA